jgi:hypothetical protein
VSKKLMVAHLLPIWLYYTPSIQWKAGETPVECSPQSLRYPRLSVWGTKLRWLSDPAMACRDPEWHTHPDMFPSLYSSATLWNTPYLQGVTAWTFLGSLILQGKVLDYQLSCRWTKLSLWLPLQCLSETQRLPI